MFRATHRPSLGAQKTVIAASGFTYVCGCRQLPATTNICKTRGCNYSFWAPDDGRCVARNMLRNYETLE